MGSGDIGMGVWRGHPSEHQVSTTNFSASGFLERNPQKITDGTLSFGPSVWLPWCYFASTLIQVGWPCLASKPDMLIRKQMPSTDFQACISELWLVPAITLTSPGQMDTFCLSL